MIAREAAPTCRVVSELKSLEALRPAWSALLEASCANEPTLSPDWLLTWWRVFGNSEGRRLRVACFEQDGRLIGLAPLLGRMFWYRHSVPFWRLEPLASGEKSEDAICCDYLNIIAAAGMESCVARLFARALSEGAFGAWDELVLPLMNGEGPMPTLLTNACREVGLTADTSVTNHAPYITLPPSRDDYLTALTGKHRQLLRYALRDFDRWAGDSKRLEKVDCPNGLARGREILVRLHRQRWQDAPNAGVFRSPRFIAFHNEVMPRLLDSGALQLVWLSAHGRPVAAMYNIVWNNKIYFYQSGRDTSLPRHLRPGVVIIAKVIQTAIESGVREFDFLGGASTYKMQLALSTRPLVELRVARKSIREAARRTMEACVTGYRHWRTRVDEQRNDRP